MSEPVRLHVTDLHFRKDCYAYRLDNRYVVSPNSLADFIPESATDMTIWTALRSTLTKFVGWPVAIVGLVLNLWAFFYAPADTISLKYFILITSFLVWMLLVAIDFAFTAVTQSKRHLPRVVQGLEANRIYGENWSAMLLLQNSEWFGHESLVSVYQRHNQVEVLVGWGFVLTIQEDGLIQVLIRSIPALAKDDLWERVSKCDSNAIASLVVKPSVPKLLIPNLS